VGSEAYCACVWCLLCSVLAFKVESSYQGSMGKRPALLCRDLAECPADLDPTCLLVPNTTADAPAVTVGSLDTCSLTGVADGPVVPGVFAAGASVPEGACTSAQACTVDGFRCSYAAGTQFCKCSGGVDTCTPLGECYETSCTTCQDCLTKVNGFVASQLRSTDVAATAAAFRAFCDSQLPRATNRDCQLTAEAILASPYGNLRKRAATLCAWVKCELGCCWPSAPEIKLHLCVQAQPCLQSLC
jgi:hypothetical protein